MIKMFGGLNLFKSRCLRLKFRDGTVESYDFEFFVCQKNVWDVAFKFVLYSVVKRVFC